MARAAHRTRVAELNERERLYVEASLPPSRHPDLWRLLAEAHYMPEHLGKLSEPTIDEVDEDMQRLCFSDAWLSAEITRQ